MKKYLLIGLLSLFCLPLLAEPVKVQMRCTGYSQDEDGGSRNCMGGKLREGQCAVDTDYYPLGTVFKLADGTTLVATDRGSAVCGRHHIDIFGNHRIRDYGTQVVTIVRLGTKDFETDESSKPRSRWIVNDRPVKLKSLVTTKGYRYYYACN